MASSTRGRRQLYSWGNSEKSIAELLRDPEVYWFLRKYSDATKRNKRRELLRKGEISPEIVDAAPLPPAGFAPPSFAYGSQRRRANLPLKNKKGEVMQGPRLTHDEHFDSPLNPQASPPSPMMRLRQRLNELQLPRKRKIKPRTYINLNGKRTSAKKALVEYPKLREHLLGLGRGKSEFTLRARLRKKFKAGEILQNLVTLRPEIVQDPTHCVEGDTIAHYVIQNTAGETSPRNFMGEVRDVLLRFFREHANNKVQLGLVCDMVRGNEDDDRKLDRMVENFETEQESIYEATNVEQVFERMVELIDKKFGDFNRNVSGWELEQVVKLEVTLSHLNPLNCSFYMPLPKWKTKKLLSI